MPRGTAKAAKSPGGVTGSREQEGSMKSDLDHNDENTMVFVGVLGLC